MKMATTVLALVGIVHASEVLVYTDDDFDSQIGKHDTTTVLLYDDSAAFKSFN